MENGANISPKTAWQGLGVANFKKQIGLESYYQDVRKLLYTTSMREEYAQLLDYAAQYGVSARDVDDMGLKHVQQGRHDWVAQTVAELAQVLEGDRYAATRLFYYQALENNARVLINRHWDLKQSQAQITPQTQQLCKDLQADIGKCREHMGRYIAELSGQGPHYCRIMTDHYIGNIRQHLGLDAPLGRM